MEKVLFIDDEAHNLESMKFVFGYKYEIYTANNGKEALDVLRGNDIEVVVSDLNMPEMNGLQFARELRQVNPFIVLVALTANSRVFELMECREAGFDDYLLKPVQADILEKVINESIDKIKRWTKIIVQNK